MAFNGRWAPYVPVAKRRANAAREASKLAKKGQNLRPIHIKSRAIATSFWGLAWCKNLENYADWANGMPRGRTYARNGSIVDLQIEPGKISAMVSGSSLYKIKISIDPLEAKKWKAIRDECARQVSSLLDLMRGKLPDVVLARLTDPTQGMFPSPKELKLQCSCPDYATMCKHVAAALYGVGYLLDTEPALFFKMRGVDQSELVSDAMATQTTNDAIGLNQQSDLAGEDLSTMFGIDFATAAIKNPRKSKAKANVAKRVKTSSSASNKTAATKAENASPKPLGKKAASKKAPSKKAASKKVASRKVASRKATAVSPPESNAKSTLRATQKPIATRAKKRVTTNNETR